MKSTRLKNLKLGDQFYLRGVLFQKSYDIDKNTTVALDVKNGHEVRMLPITIVETSEELSFIHRQKLERENEK